MKILFLTPRLPYPVNRGDKVRPFHFARVLSKKHDLHLLSLIQSKKEIMYAAQLKKYFDDVYTVYLPKVESYLNMGMYFWNNCPLQINYFCSKKFEKKLQDLLCKEQYDAVYGFHIRMAPYLQICDNHYRIFDPADAVSLFIERLSKYAPLYKKPVFALESKRLRKYERELLGQFDESWVISRHDREAIENGTSYNNLYIMPNGIDSDYFNPAKQTTDKNIIFVGYMGHESVDAVLYFIENMWDEIKCKSQGIKFFIIGADPPPEIMSLHNGEDIFVKGFVPDLREYYLNASVAVAPMRFVVGMQNKILEAMAMEVPVVTTSFGNQGICAQDRKEIFVEDSPSGFAERVSFLINNPDIGSEIGRNARKFVKSEYDWNNVYQRIDAIDNIISRKRQSKHSRIK